MLESAFRGQETLYQGIFLLIFHAMITNPVWIDIFAELLEPWLGLTISFFVSVFLIWTLLLYARTNLAYLLLCP